jgi:hypothetical protein
MGSEVVKILNKRTVGLRLMPHALTLAVLVLLVVGCSGSKVTTKSSVELPRYQIHTIALVPFTTLATPQARDVADRTFSVPPDVLRSDIERAVPLNIERSLSQTVTVPTGAGDIVTQLLWNRLRAWQGVIVLSPDEVAKMFGSSSPSQPSAGQSSAMMVAKQLKADASLIGQVLVYQERVGGRFGASPPATVGFEAKVVAADGQVLWEGNYYEKQRPMNEDVMGFIQRRGMFVTAEELAAYGVEHMLHEFPFGTVGEH